MVDFEKAFYSVTFDFISDALEILGFGSVHKKRINSLLGKKQFMLLFGEWPLFIKDLLHPLKTSGKWLGLRVNSGKKKLKILGGHFKEKTLLNTFQLKWCTIFKLLGIQFYSNLENMSIHFDKGLDKIKRVAINWKLKYLKIFDKITVGKTFMLSKLRTRQLIYQLHPRLNAICSARKLMSL